MVFSSIPAYLDPSNWHQQQNHQIVGNSSADPLLPPLAGTGPHPPHVGPVAGSIRPGSMSERARLANIPLPEAALKCPRCESTNTKFCYFNNYSLSQPRHFCKTCRRYWTRGGSMRNVPVGGGCRRNKRTKPSKSPASSNGPQTNNNNNNNNPNPSSTSSVNPTHGGSANLLGLPPMRFMSPESFDHHMGLGDYAGITAPAAEMGFHGGGGGEMEPWRMQSVQQFPFLSGLEQPVAGISYRFDGGESSLMGASGGQTTTSYDHRQTVRPRFSGSMMSRLESIKMEGRPELNLSRELLGNNEWNNNNNNNNNVNWTDQLSSFNSSSTSNHM
ncbi:hypothetical protein CASFOL_027668 [Castilleja foliolosa]|uniref:Dof zinc finger protein n=1 Tax=Castilleja foliolosa TaxID=1961234 RepID=A0ABD3CJ11_9LAMI